MGKNNQPSYQKLKVNPIVQGKRPGFEEDPKLKKKKEIQKPKKSYLNINPSQIACKEKRIQILAKKQKEQKKLKKKERKQRQQECQQTGKEKLQHLTTDDKKEVDENFIFDDEDVELQNEENFDEFQSYFQNDYEPKILMTTNQRPHGELFDFLKDIKNTFPNCHFYPRKALTIKQICEEAPTKGYTDIMVWRENKRQVNELVMIHLPKGPTAIFKVTNDKLNYDIQNHGRPTDHYPELILNNFNTNLGRRVGRFFAALFPQKPEFKARTVVTFHNQRDFIFFRHHRYQFTEEGENVQLQEIGPRFTLKLKKLQLGIFDKQFGDIEFEATDKMYESRKRVYI